MEFLVLSVFLYALGSVFSHIGRRRRPQGRPGASGTLDGFTIRVVIDDGRGDGPGGLPEHPASPEDQARKIAELERRVAALSRGHARLRRSSRWSPVQTIGRIFNLSTPPEPEAGITFLPGNRFRNLNNDHKRS